MCGKSNTSQKFTCIQYQKGSRLNTDNNNHCNPGGVHLEETELELTDYTASGPRLMLPTSELAMNNHLIVTDKC